MRRIAAEHEVELSVGERQALGGAAYRADIAQVTLGSRRGDHVEHLLGQIISHHFTGQRRHVETHMAGTAPQVQHPGIATTGQRSL
ncbi:hypothetical protein D3C78_1385360 [compost metagenome]